MPENEIAEKKTGKSGGNAAKIFVLIGFVILLFVLSKIDLGKTLQIISKVNPFYLLLLSAAMVSTFAIKAIRWNYIVSHFAKTNMNRNIQYYYAAFFPSIITPGRAGEFLKAFYLRKELGLPKAFATVLVDRVADIIALLFFSLVASVLFIVVFSREIIPPYVIAVAIVAFVALLYAFFRSRHVEKFLHILVEKLAPGKYREKLKNSLGSIKEVARAVMKPKKILVIMSLSIFSWLAVLVICYFLLGTIAKADLVLVMIAVPLMVLSDLLPISVSGIGTREGVLSAIFLTYGLSIETAVAFSFLIQISGNVSTMLVSYFFFTINPVKLEKDL